MIEFFLKHPDKIISPLVTHVELVLITLAISVVIAAVLTILSMRWRRIGEMLMAIFSVVYSIPSLALFALLIPVTGLGKTSAVIVAGRYHHPAVRCHCQCRQFRDDRMLSAVPQLY